MRLRKRLENIVSLDDIDHLLTAFNHVGLMLQNKDLDPMILPAATHANIVDFYWPTVEQYVKLRRKTNPMYGIHLEYWFYRAKAEYCEKAKQRSLEAVEEARRASQAVERARR